VKKIAQNEAQFIFWAKLMHNFYPGKTGLLVKFSKNSAQSKQVNKEKSTNLVTLSVTQYNFFPFLLSSG
jgi:hypothetical protein